MEGSVIDLSKYRFESAKEDLKTVRSLKNGQSTGNDRTLFIETIENRITGKGIITKVVVLFS